MKEFTFKASIDSLEERVAALEAALESLINTEAETASEETQED